MAEQDKVRFDREYDEYAKNLAKVTLASIPKPPANREVAASQSHDAKGQSDSQSNLHKMVSSAGSLGSSELTRRCKYYDFVQDGETSAYESINLMASFLIG